MSPSEKMAWKQSVLNLAGGPVEQSIVRLLLESDSPLTARALADRIYGHLSDGGPDYANGVMRLTVFRLRQKLPGIARIERAHSTPRRGWRGYRIVPELPAPPTDGGGE